MSLINNVLKGLDSKPATFTPLQLDQVKVPVKPFLLSRFSYILLLLVAIVCTAYLAYKNPEETGKGTGSNTEPDLPAVAMLNQTQELPEKLDSKQKLDVSLSSEAPSGLQINENRDYLEMSLLLPEGSQAVLTYSGKNRYVFLISRASAGMVVPEMRENQWLRKISLNQTTAGIELEFMTATGVLVETQQQLKAETDYWVIRFKKTQIEKSAVLPTVNAMSQQKTEAAPTIAAQNRPAVVELKSIEAAAVKVKPVRLEIKPVKSKLSNVDRLNQAQAYMLEKNWKPAEDLLLQLIGSPLDVSARASLLNLYRHQQKNGPMTQLLSASVELYPDEEEFKLIDAQNLFERQNFSELIIRYQNESVSRDVLNLVASSLQQVNSHEQAMAYFKRSLTLDPQQPKSWISLAISQEQNGLFGQALQSYQMAQRSGPLTPRLQEFSAARIQQLAKTAQ